LLDWTARQVVTGKRGATPEDAPPIFERLKIKPAVWLELVFPRRTRNHRRLGKRQGCIVNDEINLLTQMEPESRVSPGTSRTS
ncbi:MAG: hypothetical protein SFV81_27080, partial [Pirellulaceae bacterium]|nr:hypothetical protein [Pirellulaceae bacterium]